MLLGSSRRRHLGSSRTPRTTKLDYLYEVGEDVPRDNDRLGSESTAEGGDNSPGGGALGGAIAGAALGSAYGPGGTLGGAVMGAVLGDSLAERFDERERY